MMPFILNNVIMSSTPDVAVLREQLGLRRAIRPRVSFVSHRNVGGHILESPNRLSGNELLSEVATIR